MSQKQRRRAQDALDNIHACNKSPNMTQSAITHLHTLLSMVVSALFPVADDDQATDDDPCNCPQAFGLQRELDASRAATTFTEAGLHRQIERAEAAEERADRAELRVAQLAERIAEDVADETTAAVRLGNVCVYLGCCDQAFAETAAKTMVERAAQVDAAEERAADLQVRIKRATASANNERDLANTAELCLARARAEWTSTRGDLEAENERLHERLRLLQRTCPGPSPAAQVMQPVTPFHRDEAIQLVVERLRACDATASHYRAWAWGLEHGDPDPGSASHEPLIYLAQVSFMAGRESMVPVAPAAPLTTVDGREWPPDVVSMPAPLATTAAVLDDPRMDGVYWNAATDVSVAMLHAWPFWERWTADSTDVLPCHQVDFGPGANTTHKLRPLRLPGMDTTGDGVVAARAMTDAHFARVAGDWHWRSNCSDGRWTPAGDDEGPDKRLAPEEQWRPAIWATLDTTEATFPQ